MMTYSDVSNLKAKEREHLNPVKKEKKEVDIDQLDTIIKFK